MASLRQIRRRLRSIQSTKQVMRAMQLVSGSKFKRAHARLAQSRQVLEFLDGLLQRMLETTPSATHPLMTSSPTAPSVVVLVTSDAGLAGSYNANLIQLAEAELRRDSLLRTELVYLGKRGARYLTKRGYAAREAYLDLAGRPDLNKIEAIGTALLAQFLAGRIGAVKLLYARFVSATTSRPTIKPWLPIHLSQSDEEGRRQKAEGREPREYIFEPSPTRVFEDLLPRWALATFRRSILEAFTSEHGARMVAMKNATDNAQGLLDRLTRQRNKIRQAMITKELSEIVGTVEALK